GRGHRRRVRGRRRRGARGRRPCSFRIGYRGPQARCARRKGGSMQQLDGHGAAPAIAPARGRRSGATARNRTAGLHARQRGSAGLAPYGAWRGRMQWAIGLLLLLALLPVLAQPAPAANADPSSRTVLVMGDSLSAGYGMAARQGWVSLLGERLAREKPGWRVVNA